VTGGEIDAGSAADGLLNPLDRRRQRLSLDARARPDRKPGKRIDAATKNALAGAFPYVVIHTTQILRDAHPRYAEAKSANPESADPEAALSLSLDLIDLQAVERLRGVNGGRKAILLPVTALEIAGINTIPDAMAQILAEMLDWLPSLGDVVQTNKVGHTKARAFNRLVTPASFEGRVLAGADYVLVDDHVGVGGTLASLKGFLETNGGRVVGMTTLTESRDARQIALRTDTLDVLRAKHGEELEDLWRRQFGYGLACLTNVEGGILCRERSVDAIRNRLAQAVLEARERGLAPRV
jgi:hypothetical protein